MSSRFSAARLGLIFIITFFIGLLISLILLTITALRVGRVALDKVTTFTQTAQTTPAEVMLLGALGWFSKPAQSDGRKNILVLGLDSLATRGDAVPLTDTIILVSVDLESGHLKGVSFPRDLWLPDQDTRVNALYAYGLQKNPTQPEIFPQEIITELTQIPIHHTIVISLDELGEVIDLIGGVSIDVKTGFIDPEFPRTDVDVTIERDPAKLYETVEFKPGVQTMDGQTALKYIRSRHAQGSEGSDNARSARQQQVIEALMKQTLKSELLRQPTQLGNLYLFYKQHFADDFPTQEAIATGHALLPHLQNIAFTGASISIFPDDAQGVLFHPPLGAYRGQWVYVIRDLELFRNEVKTKLNLSQTPS